MLSISQSQKITVSVIKYFLGNHKYMASHYIMDVILIGPFYSMFTKFPQEMDALGKQHVYQILVITQSARTHFINKD